MEVILEQKQDFDLFYRDFSEKNKRIIIICTSYPSVQIVISLLEAFKNDKNKIELFVSNDDLYRFYKQYFKGYYSHIINYNKKSICYKKIYDIPGIILEKIYLIGLKKRIHYTQNANVLFFSWDFVNRNFYLLSYLKKKDNKLFNIKIGELGPGFYETSIKGKVKEKISQLLYGKEISLLKKINNSKFLRINDSFLSDVSIFNVDFKKIKTVFKTNQIMKIENNIKIIYFDTPEVSNSNILKELKIHLLKILNIYVNSKNEIGIKQHPGRKINRHILKFGVEIQSTLPSELIDYSGCKLAIGFGSYTLSKSNINDIPGICLTYLAKWDKNLERSIIKQMKSINENLYYPKSVEELDNKIKEILING